MSERLDDLIERLATAPADRPLDALEAEIAFGITRRRDQARLVGSLAPVRAAAVGLAMALGLAVGGVTAAAATPARHADAFAVAPALAPSTLLEGGR